MQHMDSDMDVRMTKLSLYHSTLQAINSSGDTLLHVAVNDDRGDMVEKLVMEITRSGSLSALQTKNDRGDTPLHRAASRGSLQMCKCIAEAQRDTQLIEARNKEGETPLFLAALQGEEEAFLYLHSRCPDPSRRLWKRSSDGETILHCTIRRDHFELALEIIRLYGTHIVGSVDEKGISPLHTLADKPSAFESSSNFRWYNKLAYNCDGEKKEEWDRKESALFVAAKNGVLEILKKILKDKPGAIHETNSKGQNVLHIAVEYRQPHVLKLLEQQKLWDNLVQSIDNEGNTILHLAARLSQYKPWHIPGSALQMQWEIKWFLYVKDIMPNYVSFLPNKGHKTPVEIFREDHENLIKEGTDWLNHTSQSCSVVAALIAGVAFATSTNVPGGTQEQTGMPTLESHPAFNMFALTSLLSLCCSITGLIMFLAILTSRHQPRDFRKDLPLKLFFGLSSLFVSIASVLVSFSAAFFFVLKEKQVVFLLYAATVLPAAFYAVSQFALYVDLVRAIFRKDPQSSNRESEKLIL
ncbi:ankyrin repeat-containing protein At5g02620-like [Neltuma alba]|uniref:ankyrin repeat-containing protein At5g02620-like n=1 Tax=Neltuma alba TaxID=207710 RepID=UPI0010A34FFA|nr:ankyrin repeat-containing protein At5g02620-like [Prosopis alba]